MFTFDFPPSVNTHWRTYRGRMILSERGRDYRAAVCETLSRYESADWPLTGRLGVYIVLQRGDRRKYDIDNYVKPILDALQAGGVIEDDEQVDEIELRRGPVQPGDGMALVGVEQILRDLS